jgi:hypothetical protein
LLVIAGHVLIVLALLGMLAFGNHDSVAGTFGEPIGTDLSPTLQLLIWAAAATFVAILLGVLYDFAAKARYSLKYLWPTSTEPRWRWRRCWSSGPTRTDPGAGGGRDPLV